MKKHNKTGYICLGIMLAGLWTAGCGRGSKAEHFGEPFTDAPRTAFAELKAAPDSFYRKPIRVSGVIERQCPASGCWFFLRDDKGTSIRVDLGDTHPQLPQRVGRTAEVEGEWIKRGNDYEFIGTRVTFEAREAK